jgi:hypothetical protein
MRSTVTRPVVVLAVVAVALSAVPASAAYDDIVVGRPNLDLDAQDDRLAASEDRPLTVVVTNDGVVDDGGPAPYEREVTTARAVRMEVLDDRIDAPIEVTSGPVTLGSVPDGRSARATFQVETGADLEPGTYRIPVRVEYQYRRAVEYRVVEQPPGYTNPEYADSSRVRTKHVTVTVAPESRFAVAETNTSGLVAGDTGDLRFVVENVGSERASDATVRLTSGERGLYFGAPDARSRNASVYVDSLSPGERHAVTVQVGATDELSPGAYPVRVALAYDDANGIARRSDPLSAGVTVGDERAFALRNVTTERLRVAEDDAVVRGEVANVGDTAVHDAVVRLSSGGAVRVTGPESAVGDLAPGESAPVSFRLAVPEDAEPGSRSLAATVEYENAAGDVRTTRTPLREAVTVGPEREPFEVVGVDTGLRPGGDAEVRVEIRHAGTERVRNAEARLFVTDPLSASDSSAYLGTMDPGETTTATFRVSASGDALAKAYAGAVEVRYDDADGDSTLADGLSAGISVTESEGGLPWTYVGLGAGLVVLGGGLAVYRRD